MKSFVCSIASVAVLTTSCAGTMSSLSKRKLPSSIPVDRSEDSDEYFAVLPDGACSEPFAEGVYMSWPNARRYLADEADKELAWKMSLSEAREVGELERVRREAAEAQVSDAAGWWADWAFPIGFAGGLLTSAAIAAAIVSALR